MAQDAYSEREGYYVTLPDGQIDHYFIDSFTDPWRSKSARDVLLIQHGFARSGSFWYHWVAALARDYIVIRRDLRGHGKSSYPIRQSPWSEEPGVYKDGYSYNLETICSEIIQFLDCLGVDKVHFLGESTSGQIGHALAALHPERIRSLITCSAPTHLPADKCNFLAMGQPSWPEALVNMGSRGWAKALSEHPGTAPRKSKEYQEWWLSEVGKIPSEGLAGYAAFLSQLDTRPLLPKIRCPALILAPTRSAAVPMEESEYAANHISQAVLKVVDVAGHEIYVEAPEICWELVLEHLAQCHP